jgi:8-oxo-dGTP diphosphatase
VPSAKSEAGKQVLAAGAVLWRPHEDSGQPRIAVIHRPRYDDWSLPKGKLDAGESFEEAALREVREETGLECELGRELEPVSYVDQKGRPKIVRYWLMEVTAGEFEANEEVDEMRWLPPAQAAGLLTYPHDRELVEGVEA